MVRKKEARVFPPLPALDASRNKQATSKRCGNGTHFVSQIYGAMDQARKGSYWNSCRFFSVSETRMLSERWCTRNSALMTEACWCGPRCIDC